MRDNQLYAAIRTVLLAGFAAQDEDAIKVKQSYQPTQQGANKDPTCYMHKLGDRRYGYMKRESRWITVEVPILNPDTNLPILNPDTNLPITAPSDPYMQHMERQWYETAFQINAMAIQNPANESQLTASDIVNMAAMIMQQDSTREALRALGIGILRVQNVVNPPFTDDQDRFEYSPSFDFTLTHEQVIISTSPIVVSYEFQLERV